MRREDLGRLAERAARELTPGELAVIVGPTGSGKTELALELAERLGGEIVGADSVQVYKHFDLGSGKPTPEELARAPHHLVSSFDPNEPIEAATFVAHAERAIEGAKARRRVPIVCGGTYLWVRALVFGLAELPPADPALRAEHESTAQKLGRAALHARLAEVDPERASELHPNDVVRVSRALEVFALTGRRQSELHAAHAFRTRRHAARLFGIRTSPEALDVRLRQRARRWLELGWVDEVRELLARGYGEARAMDSVGYREVRAHLRGELPASELEDAIVRATRIFVRRQRTWLRDAPVTWLDPDSGAVEAAPEEARPR